MVKLVWFGKVHLTDFLLVNGDVRDLCLFAFVCSMDFEE